MPKHQPATPLPWRRAPESRGTFRILSGTKLVGEASHYNEGCYENAAYIAHAANAYPRLVEALRAWLPKDEHEYGTQDAAMAALLRELGEL